MEQSNIIYDTLKPILPFGAVSRVAKKHGVSIDHVSRVLRGKRKNSNILESLYDEAKIFHDAEQKIEQKIKALHKSVA